MTNEEAAACESSSPIQPLACLAPGRVASREAFSWARQFGDRVPGTRALFSAKMDVRMSLLRFVLIRWMERGLSVRSLYRILKLVAFAHAAFPLFKRKPPSAPLPDCLGTGKSVCEVRPSRSCWYLNRTLHYFPEQLSSAKWRDCCRIVGLEHLQDARRGGRPVVLAFCHFGAYSLLQSWLRAAGFPVAALVGETSNSNSRFRQLNDQISHLVENPIMFFTDQLRQVSEFLAAGNSLLIAIDGNCGKQMSVPAREGWVFQMATGPIRLATRHQAELIPCSIIDEGRWQSRIELGRPVPRELLTAEADGISAGKHLLEEMSVHFQACPEQCSTHLAGRFRLPNSLSGATSAEKKAVATTFTAKLQRRLIGGLICGVVLTACGGCQTFSLSDGDFQKQQRGGTVDRDTGAVVGVAGTMGYLGVVIGEAVSAAGKK
jgi:hypothetical protein